MRCPACETELKISERAGVEIDYCPACRGVWLDRSELDRIIERSTGDTERDRDKSSFNNHRRSDRDDERSSQSHPPKKRESFWSELFDFG